MVPNFRDKRFQKPGIATKSGIPLLSGRPKREKVIGREDQDQMDLEILLHTCDSVEEFVAKA